MYLGEFYLQGQFDKKMNGLLTLMEGTFYMNDSIAVPHGYGKIVPASGNALYIGNFDNGLYHGHGKEYDVDGVLRYRGNFVHGTRSGFGCTFGEGGVIEHEGQFRAGKPNKKRWREVTSLKFDAGPGYDGKGVFGEPVSEKRSRPKRKARERHSKHAEIPELGELSSDRIERHSIDP